MKNVDGNRMSEESLKMSGVIEGYNALRISCLKSYIHNSSVWLKERKSMFLLDRIIITLPMQSVRISIRVRCTTLCDKVCQWLATGRWFSPCSPDSSTNKTDHHGNIVESGVKHHQTNKHPPNP
jgi:hypothetical protein